MAIFFCEMEVDCPKLWDALSPTEDPRIRNCTDCGKPVHFIDDSTQLEKAALHGHCVAYINQLPERISPDVRRQLMMLQGHNKSLKPPTVRRMIIGLPRQSKDDSTSIPFLASRRDDSK